MTFEPKILGFLCNWCSYAGADLAGVSRIQYPTNIRVVRVMCSGRVDPAMIVDALVNGIDGVLVTGCHIGDCHYITGNFHTEKRMLVLSRLLEDTPFKERVRLEWVSASEGTRFGEVVRSFTENVKALGPNPAKGNPELRAKLNAVRDTLSNPRVKNVLGKYFHLADKGNVYGEKVPRDVLDNVLDEVVRSEHARAAIFLLASVKPMTVPELAKMISIPSSDVLRHLAAMKKKGRMEMVGHEGQYPLFTAVGKGGCA